jgi:hypothetical protein
LTLHVLQLPLFGLLALAGYQLLDHVQNVAATISRLALGCFVIFYPPFDSLIGISTGILVGYGAHLPVQQRVVLENVLESFVQSPLINLIAILGSVGWQVGMIAMALALSRSGKSRPLVVVLVVGCVLFGLWSSLSGVVTVVWWIGAIALAIALGLVLTPHLPTLCLVLAALLFGVSHIPPFGPLGMTCFFVAILQLEFFEEQKKGEEEQKKGEPKQPEAISSPALPADA